MIPPPLFDPKDRMIRFWRIIPITCLDGGMMEKHFELKAGDGIKEVVG